MAASARLMMGNSYRQLVSTYTLSYSGTIFTQP